MFKSVLRSFGIDGATPSVPTISPVEAYEGTASGAITLIDVREPDEWKATGSPEGSRQIALQDPDFVSKVLTTVDGDKAKPVVVCCRSGMRGKKAGDILHSAGFIDVKNVDGGVNRWIADKLPLF